MTGLETIACIMAAILAVQIVCVVRAWWRRINDRRRIGTNINGGSTMSREIEPKRARNL